MRGNALSPRPNPRYNIPMTHPPPHIYDGHRWRGLRVGLLGGSFNPPHSGHVHISQFALRMLGLDAVWWLVTPQNPLKAVEGMKPYAERLTASRRLLRHQPRILTSDLERQTGTNRTYDTILRLRTAFPATEFVLITGLDNALTFHKWYRWRDILGHVATAHIARPPALSLVRDCPLLRLTGQNHHILSRGQMPLLAPGHSYWILQSPLRAISSTKIRNNSNL